MLKVYILTIFTAVRLKTLFPSMTSLLPESALIDWPEFACMVPLTRELRKSLSLKTVMSVTATLASTASFDGSNKMSG